jgi:hypothetical protein
MADINEMKRFFKDAEDAEALAGYQWVTGAMEVRGLIQIPGTRKKRSDAGQPRTETPAGDQLALREESK